MLSRGFTGRKRRAPTKPVPPGQYVTNDFPVLSVGPTPRTQLHRWTFTLEFDGAALGSWTWEELLALPMTKMTVDIHCVTKWTKFDTTWEGVSIDTLFESAGIAAPTGYVMAFSDGGYTTNLPVADLIDGKAMVALRYEGQPLRPEHGGPARLFVPHLYFWKSAKWVRGLRFMEANDPGFWEGYGYHSYGDPWREQRYAGD